MANVYEGQPDGRQSENVDKPVSRFRPVYRALTDEEKALHDAIKDKAAELEALFEQVKGPYYAGSQMPGPVKARYLALATTDLEKSVMWAVKALTS